MTVYDETGREQTSDGAGGAGLGCKGSDVFDEEGFEVTEPQSGGGGGGAPTNAQYVTMALNGTLTAERVLAVGASLALADGGANGNATLSRSALTGDVTAPADSNATTLAAIIAPATVGDATHVAVVTVDAKGRVTVLSSVLISGVAPGGAAGGALDGTYPNPGLAASVAGVGLSESGDVLSVNVDGTSIDISADTLRRMALTGDISAPVGSGATTLASIVGAAGPIGNATTVPIITIDAKGRVTALSSTTISGVAPGGPAGSDIAGTYPSAVTVKQSSTEFAWTGIEICPALSVDQNDYAPPNLQTKSVFRLSSTAGAAINITGLSSTGVVDGEIKWFVSTNSVITFVRNSASSLIGNRIQTAQNSFNLDLYINEIVGLQYDLANGYWNPLGKLFPVSHGIFHVNGLDDVPDFLAATASAGRHGLVPTPAGGQQQFLLKGNATWESVSGVLDRLSTGETQGDILIRNATVWTFLHAPSAGGDHLRTGGGSADPTWSGVAQTNLAPSTDQSITANYSAVVPRILTIASGKKWSIGSGAILRIL